MTEEERAVEVEAIQFARANKKAIAKRLTSIELFPSETDPVSVFMAGSPGAGKTEAAEELIAQLGAPVVRIDVDDLRREFPKYQGNNAWLFHKAASILVDKVHDFVLEQDQSFVLDATLSNLDRARQNISRSIKKSRPVQIIYVYQEPSLAWKFVQARELTEGRRVPAEQFVEQYFAARDVANQLKREFGKELRVDLLLKDFDNTTRTFHANIDLIDSHVPEKYTRQQVVEITQKV